MKSTSVILFITHAEVEIDPAVPVTEWGLSGRGRIRHEAFNSFLSELGVAQIYCSAEQKAVDGAAIAARHLGKDYRVIAALHENDRSATGYLQSLPISRKLDQPGSGGGNYFLFQRRTGTLLQSWTSI